MTTTRRLSIIVPVRDRSEALEKLLDSLNNQSTPRAEYEIIVVSNCSQEDLKPLADAAQATFTEANQQANSYYARNHGVAHAKGDLLAFIDSDCIADRDWVRAILDGTQNHQDSFFTGPIQLVRSSSSIAQIYDQLCNLDTQTALTGRGAAFTANLAIRKSLFEQEGPFPTEAGSGGDVAFTTKLSSKGYTGRYLETMRVRHPARNLIDLISKSLRVGGGKASRQQGSAPKNVRAQRNQLAIFTNLAAMTSRHGMTLSLTQRWALLSVAALLLASYAAGFLLGKAKRLTDPTVWRYGLIPLVALALLASAWWQQPPVSHNDGARWATAWSVVHKGTYNIYGSPFYTIDHIVRQIDGENIYFSRKAAFLSNIATTLYTPLEAVGIKLDHTRPNVAIILILSLVNLLPFILLLLAYQRYLSRIDTRGLAFFYCMTAAALGSYLTGYMWTLNNHLPAAMCIFFALYFLFKIIEESNSRTSMYVASLTFAALAPCFDITSGLILLIVVLTLLRANPTITLKVAPLSILLVGAYFCMSEYAATGLFLPYKIYYLLGERLPGYVQALDPFHRPGGMQQLREPKLIYSLHALIGHHGIFSLTPVLAIAGFGVSLSSPNKWRRVISYTLLLGVTPALVALLWKTRNYGGLCQGFRWLFWAIPIGLLLLPYGLKRRFWRTYTGHALIIICLAVSVYSAINALPRPFSVSWLHKAMYDAGMVTYR